MSYHRYENGFLMKQSDDKDGYKKITLTKDGKEYAARVHRLVAQAFIPNPHNKKIINHKNGIKNDNRVENLEWVTVSENTQHAFDIGLAEKGNKHCMAQKYEVYKDGKLIACYDNTFQVTEALRTNRGTIIHCIKNNEPLYDELFIKKVNNFTTIINLNYDFNFIDCDCKLEKPICIYDKDMKLLSCYSGIKKCAEINSFSRRGLKDRLDDGRIYKNKYYIKSITRLKFLTTNLNLINIKIK